MNYRCAIRTNYFHVKNPDNFREFMKTVYGNEDSIELWEEKDEKGNLVFGFGLYGNIAGVLSPEQIESRRKGYDEDYDEDEDYDLDAELEADDVAYEKFIAGLKEHVSDGDAVIILEAGNEGVGHVIGFAEIITRDDYKCLNLRELAKERAREMLGNPDWETICDC